MDIQPLTNVPASVRQRLLNLSRQNGEEFGLILSQFAIERFLYRLSLSPHRDRFLLKGAALFRVWPHMVRRPTRDVDLLGYDDGGLEQLEATFREICLFEAPGDGLRFDALSISVAPIRQEQHYGGWRVRLEAWLAQARIPLQIDVGFGDVVTPAPRQTKYPTLLGLPAPHLSMYPPETVIAEKYQAMVLLGEGNSRMKDFYDVWNLAGHMEFDGVLLSQAVRATFQRRRTALPATLPAALGETFTRDKVKVVQWNAFIRKSRLQNVPQFSDTNKIIGDFLWPLTQALQGNRAFARQWIPGQGWCERE